MFSSSFLTAALERCVRTFCNSLAALLVADGTDLLSTDWGNQLSVSGMAAVVSLLLSIAATQVNGPGLSFTGTEKLTPAGPVTHRDDHPA